MSFKFVVLALVTNLTVAQAAHADTSGTARANPIRKVVTMLETMQKKVVAELAAETELYQKFQCYCKTNKGTLTDTISAAEAKAPSVSSEIQEAESEKVQFDADLKSHHSDREAAEASIATVDSIRTKEAGAFAASKGELDANIAAIDKAVKAIERGMAGGFLQTNVAQVLRQLVEAKVNMIEMDRQTILNFLAGGQRSGYSPRSGEITGILKQLGEQMKNSLAAETTSEEAAVTDHEALVAAKKKEVAAHTAAIEEKSTRAGEVAVNIANMKNDLTDTQEALANDKAFFAELEEGCATKEAEWDERQKTRSEELLAIAETIKFLNDDDALELFKKAVPSRDVSLVQTSGSASRLRARALSVLRVGRREPGLGLDFIALALQGKTAGFEKVVKMIDEMIEVLKKEQQDDDHKKEYCGTQLDLADDKKKDLEATVSREEIALTNAAEAIVSVTDELKALADGIAELDKAVAEATEQRKDEHATFTELMVLDTQAKDLIGVAKNRLNKFYSPDLYVPPAKKELTAEEKIYQRVAGADFVQVASHSRHRAAPAPPETFGDYTTKSQESNSVIAMMDLLIQDLAKEMTVAQTEETNSQKNYEGLMAGAQAKRASDSTSVTEKQGEKASLEVEAQSHSEATADATKELAATAEYIHNLHVECDWLVQNHVARKSARASESESLANAKAILSGSDYSLVQVHG